MGLINRTEPNKTATVERREPDYTTPPDYPVDPLPEAHGAVSPNIELPEPTDHDALRRVPIAIETRKLVTVEYGQQSLQVTLDGTGAGQVDFGTVPANQWWIIDNVVARGGAAGSVLLYERGQIGLVNDLDLVYAKALLAPAFAVSDFPNNEVLRPGAHVIGGFVGAGNALVGTLRIKYRVAVLIPGLQTEIP